MPKQCAICEKKSVMSRQRKKLMSKYNPTPKKRKHANLQKLDVPENTTNKKYKDYLGKKITACTKCIKTLSKNQK